MKIILFIILIIILSTNLHSRSIGETEITTEEGIEVFQKEKYYLLKKNVKILSDNFELTGDQVKIFFDKDLYDIKTINAEGNVELESSKYQIYAKGNKLIFKMKNEEINIFGLNSELLTNDTNMYSDGEIKVKNLSGEFYIFGPNSKLSSQNIFIDGDKIEGSFETLGDTKDIIILDVVDNEIAYIKNEDTEMYGRSINYNKENSLIIIEENVKIIRDGETITGDYGTLDTKNNSYKIKSNNQEKVKIIIQSNEQ